MNRAINPAQKSTEASKASSMVSIVDSALLLGSRLPLVMCGTKNSNTSGCSSQVEAEINFHLLDVESRGSNYSSLPNTAIPFCLIANISAPTSFPTSSDR
jgi:hypothetical protein